MNFPYFPGIDSTSDVDSDVNYLLANVEQALGENYSLEEKKIVQRIRNDWDSMGQQSLQYFRTGSNDYYKVITDGFPVLLQNATSFFNLIPNDGSDFYLNIKSFIVDINSLISCLKSNIVN